MQPLLAQSVNHASHNDTTTFISDNSLLVAQCLDSIYVFYELVQQDKDKALKILQYICGLIMSELMGYDNMYVTIGAILLNHKPESEITPQCDATMSLSGVKYLDMVIDIFRKNMRMGAFNFPFIESWPTRIVETIMRLFCTKLEDLKYKYAMSIPRAYTMSDFVANSNSIYKELLATIMKTYDNPMMLIKKLHIYPPTSEACNMFMAKSTPNDIDPEIYGRVELYKMHLKTFRDTHTRELVTMCAITGSEFNIMEILMSSSISARYITEPFEFMDIPELLNIYAAIHFEMQCVEYVARIKL